MENNKKNQSTVDPNDKNNSPNTSEGSEFVDDGISRKKIDGSDANYRDPQDKNGRKKSSDSVEGSEEMDEQHGKIKPTLIDENYDALEQLQVLEK